MDFDYVINCAKVAKEANVAHVLYVSSERANASSWILYLKVKGQVVNYMETSGLFYYKPWWSGVGSC